MTKFNFRKGTELTFNHNRLVTTIMIELNFKKGVGPEESIIFLVNSDTYILERFKCDRETLEKRVAARYRGEVLQEYLEAIESLTNDQSDMDDFPWEEGSGIIAEYYPHLFDSDKYNWELASWAVAMFCPQHFDAEKYNWKRFSQEVVMYCPQHMDADRYNWEDASSYIAQYHPEHFDAEKYNWEEASWAVEKYCPEYLHLKPE